MCTYIEHLALGIFLNCFLKFRKFQPQYSYIICMFFAGWGSIRIVKNCDLGLVNAAPVEVTVFYYTDRPKLAKTFLFFFDILMPFRALWLHEVDKSREEETCPFFFQKRLRKQEDKNSRKRYRARGHR